MILSHIFHSCNFRYHHFKVKPPIGEQCILRARPENNNPYDQMAVMVTMPDGSKVGRMPKEVAAVITPAIRNGLLFEVRGIYSGNMEHDGERRGGGPKLSMMYMCSASDSSACREVASTLHNEGGVALRDMFV
jgi:hypothetical protein